MKAESGGGRPTRGYRLADGTKVPSVTTITGRFKESGGLIHWAWQMGMDGKDYKKESGDAAAAGTLAHDLIEGDILEREPRLPTAYDLKLSDEDYALALERARMAYGAYRTWRKSVTINIIATELPLVSERHRFGGTVDGVARIDDGFAIIDWKSSNRIYGDYIVQVSAYRALWEEHRPDAPVKALHLLRVGKEFGDFHHHSWPMTVLDAGWKAFQLQRELYELDAVLKRAAG